tara:strand:- start:1034 stop:2380 length:1347 start_codon:yes stop_codon:yes gene_type:complete
MGLESLYEKYPWLNKPSYHLMEKLGIAGPWGESGWLTKKLPDMVQSYENVVDPIVDFGKKLGNIGAEFGEIGLQGIEAAGDLIYDTTKWGPGGQPPGGVGSLYTDWQDNPFNPMHLFSKVAREEGSGMTKDSVRLSNLYAPSEKIVDEFGDIDLGQWSSYQNWKSGSGWDTADDRRINKRVDARMEKEDFSTDALWGSYLNMASEPGYEHLIESDDAVNWFYPQYVQKEKEYARKQYKNFFEFEETGENYGKWASREYQNELLSKYGKYPVFEDINFMSENFSPYPSLSSTFNRANEDYIKALKEGKSGMKPTEWDYGLFDDDTSVGITKEMEPYFDYSTKEAEEFYEAPQALIPEILIGGSGLIKAPKALKYLQAPLQGTKAGRIAREFAPGLFQWGKRDKFGFKKFKKDEGFKKFINSSTGVIDFLRPKGGQFIAAAGMSEFLDRD